MVEHQEIAKKGYLVSENNLTIKHMINQPRNNTKTICNHHYGFNGCDYLAFWHILRVWCFL